MLETKFAITEKQFEPRSDPTACQDDSGQPSSEYTQAGAGLELYGRLFRCLIVLGKNEFMWYLTSPLNSLGTYFNKRFL